MSSDEVKINIRFLCFQFYSVIKRHNVTIIYAKKVVKSEYSKFKFIGHEYVRFKVSF